MEDCLRLSCKLNILFLKNCTSFFLILKKWARFFGQTGPVPDLMLSIQVSEYRVFYQEHAEGSFLILLNKGKDPAPKVRSTF